MTENLRFLYLYGYNIRFRTFSKLERYTKFVEWDYGYIVVMAKYEGHEEKEEYIDLVPILENLYLDVDTLKTVLANQKGVYLLMMRRMGKYVGSATGEDGKNA